MQNFIDKMVHNPIKINKYVKNNMNTREELFTNSSNKILDKKGFSFKYFKTDKERIKAYTNKKEIEIENYNKKGKSNIKINLKKRFLYPKLNDNTKKDIKKIIDIFSHKEELNNDEKLLYKQLKNTGVVLDDFQILDTDKINNKKINKNNLFYKKKDILNIINNNSLNEEEKYKILQHNKIYNERKNMILIRKLKMKYLNNIKKLNKTNSNLFSKTHFKALENFALFKSPTVKHKINKVLSTDEINIKNKIKSKNNNKDIYFKTLSKFNETKYNTENSENNYGKYSIDTNFDASKFFSSENILNDISLRKEIVEINPLLFQYNVNYIKNINNKKNNEDIYLKDKIITLKKMAFEKKEQNNEFFKNIKYEDNLYEMLRQDEDIIIDGKKYKRIDTDKIADILLKKCNYKHNINHEKCKSFEK
jgi:hypothetical protein